MLKYFFRARDFRGAMVLDSIDALSERDAKKLISDLGLIPIEIQTQPITKKKLAHKSFQWSWPNLFAKKVTLDEFLSFNRQFQIVYRVGMPILKGLELIEKQSKNPVMQECIKKIREDVSAGRALNEAFAAHPSIFDETYVSLIKVGESSGKLDHILERIATFTEEKVENREKIKTATLYPKIVVVAFVATAGIVVYWVIPKIKVFFDQFKARLPWATELLIAVSDFCVNYWYLLLLLIGGSVFSYKKIYQSEKGRDLIDGLWLKVPYLGPLIQAVEARVFCATLELLISGGVPILESLKLVKSSLSNVRFKKEVDRAIASVDNGGSMSTELEKGKVFPELVPGLLAVGEETGEMEKILSQVGAYYHMQVKNRLDNLGKVIEPVLIFFIFVGVLILAMAIYLPIWKMSAAAKSAPM